MDILLDIQRDERCPRPECTLVHVQCQTTSGLAREGFALSLHIATPPGWHSDSVPLMHTYLFTLFSQLPEMLWNSRILLEILAALPDSRQTRSVPASNAKSQRTTLDNASQCYLKRPGWPPQAGLRRRTSHHHVLALKRRHWGPEGLV